MKSWIRARRRTVALPPIVALAAAFALATIALAAFALAFAPAASAQAPVLGPADGHDLPATDLERVAAGTEAPLFALESFNGETVALADYRGEKNVVLVFYRGHW